MGKIAKAATNRLNDQIGETGGAADLLEQMAGTPKVKGKGKAEKLVLRDPTLNPVIDQLEAARADRDKANGIITDCEDQLVAAGRKGRFELCRGAKRVESTISINGRVNFTQKCQYSACAVPMVDLQEAFGEDTDKFFNEKWEIGLTDQAAADKETVNKIIAAVGPENFKLWFTASKKVLPTETFHRALTLDPAVEEKAAPFLESEAIKPYKPTIGK